jgi:hypothetical protein
MEKSNEEKLKEINRTINIDESTPVDETISELDKRIAKLENEEKTNYSADEIITKIDDEIKKIEEDK